MKIRSIVALVVLGVVAGCGGSKNLGGKKDGGTDARTDARTTDALMQMQTDARATDAPIADARADGRTDGGATGDARRDGAVDGPKADTRPADAGDAQSPDATSPDVPAADAPVNPPVTDAPVDEPAADAPVDAPAPVDMAPDTEADAAPDTGTDTGGSTTGQDAAVGICGPGVSLETLCLAYCRGITSFCTGLSAQYASENECLLTCNRPTWACGAPGQTAGDTLFCRATHLALLVAEPDLILVECPNAGPASPACR